MIQRYFKIGFNRALRIMNQLEDYQVVGPECNTYPRDILMSYEDFSILCDLLEKLNVPVGFDYSSNKENTAAMQYAMKCERLARMKEYFSDAEDDDF